MGVGSSSLSKPLATVLYATKRRGISRSAKRDRLLAVPPQCGASQCAEVARALLPYTDLPNRSDRESESRRFR